MVTSDFKKSLVCILLSCICPGQALHARYSEIALVYGSAEIQDGQVEHLVCGLGYSDGVAKEFAKMVDSWKDNKGRPFLSSCRERLSQAKGEHKKSKILDDQLVQTEQELLSAVIETIDQKFKGDETTFELADIIKDKKACCLGYVQLLYILGNSIGLSVDAIAVSGLSDPKVVKKQQQRMPHEAVIITLSDGMRVMVDLTVFRIISRPFDMSKAFEKKGHHWELQETKDSLDVHKRFRLLDRNGLVSGLYSNRGLLSKKLGDHSTAIIELTKALELDPANATAYDNRGLVYASLGKYAEAKSDFTRAIEVDPKHHDAFCNRGSACFQLGQYEEAINDLTRAILLGGDDDTAFFNRGIALASLGRLDEARGDLLEAGMQNPDLRKSIEGVSRRFKLNIEFPTGNHIRSRLIRKDGSTLWGLVVFESKFEACDGGGGLRAKEGGIYYAPTDQLSVLFSSASMQRDPSNLPDDVNQLAAILEPTDSVFICKAIAPKKGTLFAVIPKFSIGQGLKWDVEANGKCVHIRKGDIHIVRMQNDQRVGIDIYSIADTCLIKYSPEQKKILAYGIAHQFAPESEQPN